MHSSNFPLNTHENKNYSFTELEAKNTGLWVSREISNNQTEESKKSRDI